MAARTLKVFREVSKNIIRKNKPSNISRNNKDDMSGALVTKVEHSFIILHAVINP